MSKGQQSPHRSMAQSQIKHLSFPCLFLQSEEAARSKTPIHSEKYDRIK